MKSSKGASCLLLAISVALGIGLARQRSHIPLASAASMDLEVDRGRALFMKNCAHCHGADAHGDEGPDLHRLKKSDQWIAHRIRDGVKGEMTAFGEKFSDQDLAELTMFLRSLK
jgi:mono/diheme cytochrome c family protein